MKKLLAAHKKHPSNPAAARRAFRRNLTPDERAEIDSAAKSQVAAMKEWFRKKLVLPGGITISTEKHRGRVMVRIEAPCP
jgi:hypothetical protein